MSGSDHKTTLSRRDLVKAASGAGIVPPVESPVQATGSSDPAHALLQPLELQI